MDISISPELTEFVAAGLSSGRYPSANNLVNEAISLLAQRDELKALNEDAQKAWEQARRGELIPGDEVKKRMEKLKAEFLRNKEGA